MKGPATELIHAGETDLGAAVPLTTPIYETTTFVFENAAGSASRTTKGRSTKYLYSRYANPTVVSVEQKLAALDRAEAALVFSSGMGATATILMAHAEGGRRGGVQRRDLRRHAAPAARPADAASASAPRFVVARRARASPTRVIGDRTRLRLVRVADQPDAALRRHPARSPRACRARGVLSVIDNTFASPINQQPLALGVDLAMQSATKYLNGHSDVTGGVVTGPRGAASQPIEQARRLLGDVMDPQPAYALGRGLKTLPLRIARHNANAQAVARVPRRRPPRQPGVLPGPAVASRPRDREARR